MAIENVFGEKWNQVSRYPGVRRLLDVLGIRVVPFYLYVEKRSFVDLSALDGVFQEYEFGPVALDDIAAMAQRPGFSLPSRRYLKRLGAEALCFGVRYRGEPVGYIWICLDRCETLFGRFRLRPNEAYSLQTWVREPFRRKGLAVYLKWRALAELLKAGRDILYSHVMVSNVPSVGFHGKLNAKILRLGVSFQAAHSFWICLPVKNHPLPAGVNGVRRPGGFSLGFAGRRNDGATT